MRPELPPRRGGGRALVGVAAGVAVACEVVAFVVALAVEQGRASDAFFHTFRWAGAGAAVLAGLLAWLITRGWARPPRAPLWAAVIALVCAGLLALGTLEITEAISASLN